MPTERADHPDPTMALLLLLTLRIGHALWPEGRDRVRVFDVALAKQAQRQHQVAQALRDGSEEPFVLRA